MDYDERTGLMAEMPASAEALLKALVEIENRATLEARMAGCKCKAPVAGNDRNYPYCVFNRDTAVGKPFDQIPWEMVHEDGCPMDGQKGVG
jgi:hypothetical protein